MKSVLVDRGDRVQAGQVIAVIESPEIDQQYNAAVDRPRAQAAQPRALAGTAGQGQHHPGGHAAIRDRRARGRSQRQGPGDHEGLPDPSRAVRRAGDGALCRSRRADHQRADQLCQRAADHDHLRRQPAAGLLLRPAAGRAVHQCRRCRRGHRCQQSRTPHEGQGLPHDRRARDPHPHHADRDQHRQHRGLPGRRLLRQRRRCTSRSRATRRSR